MGRGAHNHNLAIQLDRHRPRLVVAWPNRCNYLAVAIERTVGGSVCGIPAHREVAIVGAVRETNDDKLSIRPHRNGTAKRRPKSDIVVRSPVRAEGRIKRPVGVEAEYGEIFP